MDAKTWQQAKQWLIEAAALPDSARAAFLTARCPDEAVRRELMEMLASDGPLTGIVSLSTLARGSRLGPYEIDTVIGAGGMGEVYRARDGRLGRDVAIKVLPVLFASDRDRLARFEREAKLLGSLNHPHICTLFDVGREAGTDFIVMEYVDGELLSDRLRKGPLPVDKALACAIEIADALDKAHALGIVHRDLKPGNVMLTKSGAKLLDFGLARSTRTPSHNVTKTGMLLGTLRYMSPEQLQGAEADARSDVWAFGCVLYQMLTARLPFDGESDATIGAAILGAQPPPLAASVRGLPPPLQRIVDRCLAKEPDDRWQSVVDLRHELEWVASGRLTAGAPAEGQAAAPLRDRVAWAVAALAAALAIAAGSFVVWNARRAPAPALMRKLIAIPDGIDRASSFALSRDGLQLAFVGHPRDRSAPPLIWVRSLVGDADARSLPGTAGSRFLFWSPEGRRLGFFADGKLKSIDVASGVIHELCPAPNPRGGTWGGHTILFVPEQHSGIHRVADDGGQASPVTTPQQLDDLHRFPSFLADGAHFLFTRVKDGVVSIEIGSLADRGIIELQRNSSWNLGRGVTQAYVFGGMLVFALNGSVVAQALDEKHWRLSADQVLVAKDVDIDDASSQAFAVSDSTVVYRSSLGRSPSQLTWLSRNGGVGPAIWDAAVFQSVQLSPDDSQAVVARSDGSKLLLWAIDLARAAPQQLTVGSGAPVLWSPNGDRVLFRKPGEVFHDSIYSIRVDGSGSEQLVANQPDKDMKWPLGWSETGSLLYGAPGRFSADLWELSSGNARIINSAENANIDFGDAAVTRKGDLIASVVGRSALYVQPIRSSRRTLVSGGSVAYPRWRADGHELYFIAAGHLMAADVSGGDPVKVSMPHPLFEFRGSMYSPTRDGQRFLALVPQASGQPAPVGIVLNWTSLHAK
ncbi:MAG TPA: protein kinase [Vicinamibacterales bacterium]|jgi:Tol biopolymer transport system component/predicted Ser/Thr protein kinase